MRNKLLTVIILLRVSSALFGTVANAQAPACYPAYVVSFKPGKTKAGNELPEQSNYEAILGPMEGDAISLGMGGEIVLGFLNPVPISSGDDLFIQERDGNNTSFPERVKVSVSMDGVNYTDVSANLPQSGALDIDELVIPQIKYVKLTDVSDPNELKGDVNGYDLDRIIALHGCGTECNDADKPTATLNNPGFQCPDGASALDVTLTGTGPWSLGYTNGPVLKNVELINANATIPFEMDGNVRLSWVTDQSNNCTRVLNSDAMAFIADSAQAYFHRDLAKTTCDQGAGVWLSVVLKGKFPWSFTYSVTNENGEKEVTVQANKPEYNGKDKVVHHFKVTEKGEYKLLSANDACMDGEIDAAYSSIKVIGLPTAQFTSASSSCVTPDETALKVALTGTAPWQLTWAVDETVYTETNIENATFEIPVNQPGRYVLKSVQSLATCQGPILKDSAITVSTLPVAKLLESDTLLCDPNAVIELAVQLEGTAPYTFAYTRNGVTVDTVITSEETYAIPAQGLGTYALAWVRNSCGNGSTEGEARIQPTQQGLGSFTYKVLNQTCNTATLELVPDMVQDNFKYRWYAGKELIGDKSIIQYHASSWKAVNISLAITNGLCADSIAQIVEIEALVANRLGRFHWAKDGEILCEGQTVTFTSDSVKADFIYQWKVNNELVNEEADFSYMLSPGEHTVHLMVDNGHCLFSSQQTITIAEASMDQFAEFEYELLDATQCDSRTAIFFTEAVDSTLSYRWFINGEEVSQKATFEHSLPLGQSKVVLEVAQGECSSMGEKLIEVEDNSLLFEGAFDYAYEPVNCNEWSLSATALDLGGQTQHQWWIDGELKGEQNKLNLVLPPGEHTIQLSTELGTCRYEKFEDISLPGAESLVNVPNVLSPQAQHSEDRVIKVYGNCLSADGFHFQVIDRWGKRVYETKSLEAATIQGWDGGNHTAGIYTYSLRARFDNGDAFQKQGTITLLK